MVGDLGGPLIVLVAAAAATGEVHLVQVTVRQAVHFEKTAIGLFYGQIEAPEVSLILVVGIGLLKTINHPEVQPIHIGYGHGCHGEQS